MTRSRLWNLSVESFSLLAESTVIFLVSAVSNYWPQIDSDTRLSLMIYFVSGWKSQRWESCQISTDMPDVLSGGKRLQRQTVRVSLSNLRTEKCLELLTIRTFSHGSVDLQSIFWHTRTDLLALCSPFQSIWISRWQHNELRLKVSKTNASVFTFWGVPVLHFFTNFEGLHWSWKLVSHTSQMKAKVSTCFYFHAEICNDEDSFLNMKLGNFWNKRKGAFKSEKFALTISLFVTTFVWSFLNRRFLVLSSWQPWHKGLLRNIRSRRAGETSCASSFTFSSLAFSDHTGDLTLWQENWWGIPNKHPASDNIVKNRRKLWGMCPSYL